MVSGEPLMAIPTGQKRITIIPRIHGKITTDGKPNGVRCEVEMLYLCALVLLSGTIAGCTAQGDGLVPKYKAVVSAIQKGALSPDANGRVVLPPDYRGLVISDTVFVTGSEPGSRRYLFSTWQGKGSNLQGYLYCEGAQPRIGEETKIRCFVAMPPFAGENSVTVDRDVGSGWYCVYRGLD
jgi:hypothetical protein